MHNDKTLDGCYRTTFFVAIKVKENIESINLKKKKFKIYS